MAKDKVSAKIAANAKEQVQAIKAEFDDRRRKLEDLGTEQASKYKQETKRLVEEEAQRIRREILSEARLAARRLNLTTKHELVRDVIEAACKKFTQSKNYSALLNRIVSEHGKGAEVFLSPEDKKRFRTTSWGKKAKEAQIRGGVILRTSKQDINFSLDAVFETLGEGLTLQIAEILFEGDARSPGKK